MDLVTWTFTNNLPYDEDKPLYIDVSDPTQSLSANQCRKLVRQLVSGFQHQGLQIRETIYYTPLYLGIIGSGACFTGATPGYTTSELAHHLRTTQAKYLIFEANILKVVVEAAKECGIPESRLFVLDKKVPDGYQSWEKLLEQGEQGWVSDIDADETTAAYVGTSGTSGLPKAAILTHSYMVSQAEMICQINKGSWKTPQLIATPPFHVFTIPIQHAIPLKQGAQCYIMARYEQESFLNAVEKFNVKKTVVVPPLLLALGKAADTNKLMSLREIFVGGCHAADEIQQQLYEKLHPEVRILQVYGLTETGWAAVWQGKHRDRTGSVGMPLPGTKFRLLGMNGQIVKKDGMEGEIHIKAPHPMKGYLNNTSSTVEAFAKGGWVRTGDVGYVKKGTWYVVDRTKDLIKVRGWQVSPAEIEAVLVGHPKIVDAAVIGIAASDGTGEVPQAFVVRAKGGQIEEEDVKTFLRGRLARYKKVEQVVFVDRIPRNPTGKILRRVLRAAREPQIPTVDQEVAAQYAKTLRDLGKRELEKKARRSPCNKRSSRTQSQSADTSTIKSPLLTPPLERSSMVGEAKRKVMKRKGDELEMVESKRIRSM